MLPQTNGQVLHNFGGGSCGGQLAAMFTVSCDSGFANVGLDLGATNLADEADSFGFDSVPPLDLPDVAGSNFPAGLVVRSGPSRVGQIGDRPGKCLGQPTANGAGRSGIANKGVRWRRMCWGR